MCSWQGVGVRVEAERGTVDRGRKVVPLGTLPVVALHQYDSILSYRMYVRLARDGVVTRSH